MPRSLSPFDGDSPLSDTDSDQPGSVDRKTLKRKRGPPRLASHVSPRELKALQEGAIHIDSPRTRRKPSTQEVTIKGTRKKKGKSKTSPVTRTAAPMPSRPSRRGLRSSSQDPSVVSKQESRAASLEKAASVSDGDRDELDILAEEEENKTTEDYEAEDASPHRAGHPKKKRKRVARASKTGEDEDYLPEDQERSIKKRKLEAKEADLDHSLDTVDLGAALETAEGDVSAISNPQYDAVADDALPPAKKPKSKKRKQSVELLDATVDMESSESDLGDEGSDFRPSPEPENTAKVAEGAEEQEADPISEDPLLPHLSSKHSKISRKLNPDSRGYIPPAESDSDSDGEVIKYADLLKDVEGIMDGVAERNSHLTLPENGLNTVVDDAEKGKTKKKRSGGGGSTGRKSKKGGSSSIGRASGQVGSMKTESLNGMDVDLPGHTLLQADSTLTNTVTLTQTSDLRHQDDQFNPILSFPVGDDTTSSMLSMSPVVKEESKPKPNRWFFRNWWGSTDQPPSREASTDPMDID